MSTDFYRHLADLVLILHLSFVAFVILGLLAILCGGVCRWKWIRNPWFRSGHLAAIGIVVIQAWLGIICPLTTLENHFRENAKENIYDNTFVAHWLHKFLFFGAPPWVFIFSYSLFGIAVIFSWLKLPPRPFRRKSNTT